MRRKHGAKSNRGCPLTQGRTCAAAVKDRAEAYERHVRDSLALLPVLDARMEAALAARGATAQAGASGQSAHADAEPTGGARAAGEASAGVSVAARLDEQACDGRANAREDSAAARDGPGHAAEKAVVCIMRS